MYLCTVKPFKSASTLILCISYFLNLGCQMVVYLGSIGNSDNTWYVIFFISLMVIALDAQFSTTCTTVICIRTNILQIWCNKLLDLFSDFRKGLVESPKWLHWWWCQLELCTVTRRIVDCRSKQITRVDTYCMHTCKCTHVHKQTLHVLNFVIIVVKSVCTPSSNIILLAFYHFETCT